MKGKKRKKREEREGDREKITRKKLYRKRENVNILFDKCKERDRNRYKVRGTETDTEREREREAVSEVDRQIGGQIEIQI